MTQGQLLLKKTAEVLNATGHECTDNGGRIVLPKWGLRVEIDSEKVNERPGIVSIFTTIMARHPSLPGGFARELGVGFGNSLEDAVNHVSANWMLLFFPLMKFIFEPKPHDCLVSDHPIELPDAPSDAGFRLFAGPVQMVGFEKAGSSKGVGQTLLWDTFADALLPQLRPGVHHLRCYAGRTAQGISADVFLDGAEWPEGTRRLRQLAQDSLPEPGPGLPMSALKQHLLIRPADLSAAQAWERADRTAAWAGAARDSITPEHLPQLETVLHGLFVMNRHFTERDSEQALIAEGVAEKTAAELTSFLPSAAARIVLGGKAQFSETYFWRNAHTNRAIERRYDQMPVFAAGVDIFRVLYTAEGAGSEIFRVASSSAEFNAANQALHKGSRLEDLRFTSVIHWTNEPVDGEDIQQMIAARTSPNPAASPPRVAESSLPHVVPPASRRRKWKLW